RSCTPASVSSAGGSTVSTPSCSPHRRRARPRWRCGRRPTSTTPGYAGRAATAPGCGSSPLTVASWWSGRGSPAGGRPRSRWTRRRVAADSAGPWPPRPGTWSPRAGRCGPRSTRATPPACERSSPPVTGRSAPRPCWSDESWSARELVGRRAGDPGAGGVRAGLPGAGRLTRVRVAVCQLNSRTDRAANVKVARELLARAADAGADLAVLPEYTDYLGPGDQAPPPEPVDGPYATGFAEAAREHRMWVAAGSFHEVGPGGRTYNTALVFDRGGALAAAYRKIHLYDVEIPGRVSYHESRSVAPGDTSMVVDVEGVRVGLSICYDLRFPEL